MTTEPLARVAIANYRRLITKYDGKLYCAKAKELNRAMRLCRFLGVCPMTAIERAKRELGVPEEV